MTAFIIKNQFQQQNVRPIKLEKKISQLYTLKNRINLIQIQLRLRDVVLYMKGKGGKDKI